MVNIIKTFPVQTKQPLFLLSLTLKLGIITLLNLSFFLKVKAADKSQAYKMTHLTGDKEEDECRGEV